MYDVKQNPTAEELIQLADLLEKGQATVEVEGQILVMDEGKETEQQFDERILNIAHAVFCQFTGQSKDDCRYSITAAGFKDIASLCDKQIPELERQITLLKQTKRAVDSILSLDGAPKKKKSKAA